MFGLLVFLGIILALALWVASNYNALVTARNVYKNAFAQIDVQLQRRAWVHTRLDAARQPDPA